MAQVRLSSQTNKLIYGLQHFLFFSGTNSKISTKFLKWDFKIKAFILWLLLGLPGNIVFIWISTENRQSPSIKLSENATSQEKLECQELKKDWRNILEWSQFLIQGLSVLIISIFGILANLLSVIVLSKIPKNRNFQRLLIGLAVVDIFLLFDLALGISYFNGLREFEPRWYINLYPLLVHPGRGIIRTWAIFMVVAVSSERYRYVMK